MKEHTLTKGSVGKGILLFVLPIIVGSLIQQLYVTIDAVVVGQFTGKLGLAAIDSVHTLFKFPLNFMNGLASGATIIISGHCGSKDEKQMHCSIRTACTVAVILGVICSCLLYTSDAADEEDSVVLGGCRIIQKKHKKKKTHTSISMTHEEIKSYGKYTYGNHIPQQINEKIQ